MFDCSEFLDQCHAACCGIFPIEKELYEKNIDKIVTKPIKIETYFDADPFDDNIKKDFIVPITENAKCCFLQSDYKCAIYEDRPTVCKVYGDESRPNLFCHWQDKTGKKRSRQAKRSLDRVSKKEFNKLRKKLKEKR